MAEASGESCFVTRSQLVADLRRLGFARGGVLMVHTRMSALGWVVGGTQTVVEALVEAVGAGGTLLAYAGWEDDPYHLGEWPPARRAAYRRELPPFDPARSAADPDFGRIPERLRTWPGARASDGHVFRFVALGARAHELTAGVPWDFPAGAGSPLARLVASGGQVLALGAPLATLTLLHHAESLVESPSRRLVTYEVPVETDGVVTWRPVRDVDTSSRGAFPYETVLGEEDAFEFLAREALRAGAGTGGVVGAATSYLFDASALVEVATSWLSAHFA
jgi:aminoglycoside 3-N-acetyltransferase